MECPRKDCKQEIPDDSCFCDQCGTQLFRCEKCGFVGTGKFCGKGCGPMSAIQPPDALAPVAPPSVISGAAARAATVIMSLPADKIFFCGDEGRSMEIADGDVLGRTTGPHAALLGTYPVISSSHAKVTKENGAWFITDLKSTNKTYINNVKLEPNVPAKIKQDDVILLANITFTVREA